MTAADTEDPRWICDLPRDLNYGGETVTLIYVDLSGKSDEFFSEELEGTLVSSAVHERNSLVENQLNISFAYVPDSSDEVANKVYLDISGGLGSYDIVTNGAYKAITPAITGQYLNLTAMEHVDTSKLYWTQGFNDLVTFTGDHKQYLASGSVALSMFRYVFLTLYNQTELEARHVPSMYETIMNGDWTLDYQLSLVDGLYLDENGNNRRDEGDFFGFVTGNASSVDPYTVASNVHLITKDPDTAELTFNEEGRKKVLDVVDKVQLLYNNQSTYVYQGAAEDWAGKTKNIIRAFTEGNTLMVTCLFLDMETEIADLAGMSYGIAPMPKYDAVQSRYYSYVQDQVTTLGVSSVVRDADRQAMLGAVLESLAYHSNHLIPDAYYNSTLSLRFMQNHESGEILDLIFDTIEFDFSSTCSNIFSSVVIRDSLRPLYSGKSNTASGVTSRWKSRIDKELKEYNDKIALLP